MKDWVCTRLYNSYRAYFSQIELNPDIWICLGEVQRLIHVSVRVCRNPEVRVVLRGFGLSPHHRN